MDDASVRLNFLKVDEPPLVARQINERALVWAVDGRAALLEHDLVLIGTVKAARAEHRLPPGRDATRRREDVIPAVFLEELRPFEGGMPLRFRKHDLAFAQQPRAV